VFRSYDEYRFKKIIDEFVLSSLNNESTKYIIKNIDFEAFKLGISFYQMMFILIKKNASNKKNLVHDI